MSSSPMPVTDRQAGEKVLEILRGGQASHDTLSRKSPPTDFANY
jgi:hypothetical protein